MLKNCFSAVIRDALHGSSASRRRKFLGGTIR